MRHSTFLIEPFHSFAPRKGHSIWLAQPSPSAAWETKERPAGAPKKELSEWPFGWMDEPLIGRISISWYGRGEGGGETILGQRTDWLGEDCGWQEGGEGINKIYGWCRPGVAKNANASRVVRKQLFVTMLDKMQLFCSKFAQKSLFYICCTTNGVPQI
jgi:hypothetical protein